MSSIDDLINIRKEKVAALREAGIDPYPSKSERENTASEIKNNFSMLKEMKVAVAGRIMSIRPHGKITFIDLQDESGQIQLFFSQKDLGDEIYAQIKEYYDIGDFMQAKGDVFITKAGEITIKVKSFQILTKALRAIPSEFYGIKDEEEKLRRRYIDLIISKESKELFYKRSKFIFSIREFMQENAFLEVETPVLELIPGGAEANPFVTHHNTLDLDMYLRISLELHLKRLMVGGYEKVFEIGRVFRNEGMSRQHLQEFTMMEFYWAYADYNILMEFVEKLYASVIEKTFGSLKISYEDIELDFSTPWKRIDYSEALLEKEIDLSKLKTTQQIREKGIEIGLSDDPSSERNRWIDRIYKKLVRPELVQPCFLINHPVDISPLAKRQKKNKNLTERFQILAAGAEIGNGFSELNDPIDQKDRFEYQQKLRDNGDEEAEMMDEDFIEALEYGMPPTGGFGVGIDRLFSLLAGSKTIREVIFFPILKEED